MGIFESILKRDQGQEKNELGLSQQCLKVEFNKLSQDIKSFFPESGTWNGVCFSQSNDIQRRYLPCHLRDTNWMSQLLSKELYAEKYVHVSPAVIKLFMDTSAEFAKLRHDYELRIVQWQINYITHDGENWLLPEGFDDLSGLTSPDVDKMIRGGVVKTLRAIGMDGEVIEEGLEKYADLWREDAMLRSCRNLFNPFLSSIKNWSDREPISDSHKKNWLADREYAYYQEHKASVDKYGTPTDAMKMTPAEHNKLLKVLNRQNAKRMALLAAENKFKKHKKTKFVGGEITPKDQVKDNPKSKSSHYDELDLGFLLR